MMKFVAHIVGSFSTNFKISWLEKFWERPVQCGQVRLESTGLIYLTKISCKIKYVLGKLKICKQKESYRTKPVNLWLIAPQVTCNTHVYLYTHTHLLPSQK